MVKRAKIRFRKSKNYLIYAARYIYYLFRLLLWKLNKNPKIRRVSSFVAHYLKIIWKYIKKIARLVKLFFNKKPLIAWPSLVGLILIAISIPLYTWWASIPRAPGLRLTKGDYLYRADGKDFTAFLGDNMTNRPQVQFVVNDSRITFTPASGAYKIAEPTRDKNTLTFRNIYQNIDYQYQTLTNGIKENIIINQPTIIKQFPFYLDFNGATPQYVTDSIIGRSFYDKNGKYLFNFEKPYAVDAAGAKTNDIQLLLRKDKKTGKYVAIVGIDSKWMYSKDRVYPIKVDPSIVHNTSADFSGGQLNRVTDTGSGSSPNLETYYQELPADSHTVALWHMNDNVSGNGQTIADATSYGNDGTTNYGGNATGMDCTVGGKLDKGCSLDGTDDYIQVADNDSLSSWNGGFTLEAWFNATSISTGARTWMVTKGSGTGNWEYGMGLSTNGNAYCETWNASGNTAMGVDSGVSPTTGEWHHITCAFNPAYFMNVYLDGKLVGTDSVPAYSMSNGSSAVNIGRRGDNNGNEFNGTLDEIRISDTVRSSDEIKLDAQRRPYSIYTSPSIDLTHVDSLDSLSWTENGVTTGDGETISDSTDLVGQWNFNETSGTTASNSAGASSCGGTPSNCNGTLTSFSDTSGQDVTAGSGWTSDNKRWGTGALMFNGSSDYITMGDQNALDMGTSSFTISSWVKASYLPDKGYIVDKRDAGYGAGGTGYSVGLDASGYMIVGIGDGTNYLGDSTIVSGTPVNDGSWHLLAYVFDRSTGYVTGYLDGKAQKSIDISSIGNIDTTGNFVFGYSDYATANYLKADIDTTSIYQRVLDNNEILANYNAGNIEFQTRTSSDGSTWEAWKPTTNETQIDSLDTPLSTDLVSYWNLDETSGTRMDARGINNLTDNSSVSSSTGIINNAATISSDYLSCTDGSCGGTSANGLDATAAQSVTFSAWINTSTSGSYQTILSKTSGDTGPGYYMRVSAANEPVCRVMDGTNSATVHITTTVTDGAWHHITCVLDRSTNTLTQYVDGSSQSSSTSAVGSLDTTTEFRIGLRGDGHNYFNGEIDEVAFWRRALSSSEVSSLYNSGYPNIYPDGTDLTNFSTQGGIYPSSDTTTKVEGTGSTKLQIGTPQVDGNTLALWHMDETNGDLAGYDIFDSSGNGNDAEINGTNLPTAVVDGVSGKAREFNGTDDHLTIPGSSFPTGNAVTISFWAYGGSSLPVNNSVILGTDASGNRVFNIHFPWGDGTVYWDAGNSGTSSYDRLSKAASASDYKGKWTFWAFSKDISTGTMVIYLDGQAWASSTGNTRTFSTVTSADIGSGGGSHYWPGKLDEVRIDSVARSAQEIMEEYQMGRDHYLNRTISSTDLSSKNKLPFYVAGSTPGTYLQATAGESAYANYQPDANNEALYHLDEESGSGAYIKDSSGNANDATPTGTTFSAQGKMGGSRYFNGSSDYISLSDGNKLDFTTGDFTYSAWVNTTMAQNADYPRIVEKEGGTTRQGYLMALMPNTGSGLDPYPYCQIFSGGTNATVRATEDVRDGKWHNITCVKTSSELLMYVDGQLQDTASHSLGSLSSTSLPLNIGRRGWDNNYYYQGYIDEVRIDNVARTANEIRQAVEIGQRAHNVTVDFGASLDSGNLISGSGDTSFTVDATTKGLSNKGSNLYEGDKIIVRENYGGTEYIAQGNVTSVNTSTGAVTVSSWDSGSTFPSAGFTANADVFKWQREYWDITKPLDSQINAVTDLTLRVTDGSLGRTVWLDDLEDSGDYMTTPGSSTIDSTINQYFQYRAILGSSDTNVSPSLTSVTLDYTDNVAPNTPSLDSPTDTTTGLSITPSLKTTATDDDSDDLQYKIELCENLAMTTNCQTFDQTSTQTGWSGQDADSSTTYTSGTQATYTIQSALNNGTTYYWRSYAIDPAGTNTFSSTQGTPYSFTTNYIPNTPSLDTPGNGVTGTILTPSLRTTSTDTDSDNLQYKIELCTDLAMTSNCQTFDQTSTQTGWSNQNADGGTTYTSGTQAQYQIQSSLNTNTTYYWRSYAIDPSGSNTFSSTQGTPYSFTTSQLPNTPTLNSPTGGTLTITTPNLKLTGTDPDSDELQYKIELCENMAMTSNCQTFNQTSDQTGWSGQNASGGTTYTSGTQATYTVQSALTKGTTYYWRGYGYDLNGTGMFGSASSVDNFIVSQDPTQPSSLYVEGALNPVGVSTGTPNFTALCNDPDSGDSLSKYEVIVDNNEDFSSPVWDSGSSGTSMTGCTQGNRSSNITYGGTSLSLDGTTYYWKVKFWDAEGNEGTFSTEHAQFTMESPTSDAPTACRMTIAPDRSYINLTWTDNSSSETQFRIEKNTDSGGFSFLYNAAANSTSYQDGAISQGHTYQYRVRAEDGGNSSWCTMTTATLDQGSFQLKGINLKGFTVQ